MQKRSIWSVVTLVFLCLGTSVSGDVIYVDGDAPSGGDGSSWAEARNNLAAALNASGSGDAVWITSGTYTPGNVGQRSKAFILRPGVFVYGGFGGFETSPAERDPEAEPTVLSGDLAGNDGVGSGLDDNSHHVVRFNGATSNALARLDGVTITGGNTTAAPYPHGAGIWANRGRLQIRNCRVVNNFTCGVSTNHKGGGLRASAMTLLQILDSEFRGNSASDGGAVSILSSEVRIARSVFADNFATIRAAGQIGGIDELVCVDSRFEGNLAMNLIGGAQMQSAALTFHRNEVSDNAVVSGGLGGMMLGGYPSLYGNTSIRDCTFLRNDGDFGGGAGALVFGTAELVNCAVANNSGLEGAGFSVSAETAATVLNCTFSDNNGFTALSFGGVGIVRNSIVWGHPTPILSALGLANVEHSCVQNGYPGFGNISANPQLVQPGAGDVRLADESPCIDAGDNLWVPGDVTTDLAGFARIQNGTVDMGAYEGAAGSVAGVAALLGDLDLGDVEVLTLAGAPFFPPSTPAFIVTNHSGDDDAAFMAEECDELIAPDATGYVQLGRAWITETTLADGTVRQQAYAPFSRDDLGAHDPFHVDVIRLDAEHHSWALAVSANVVSSPGYESPIGDRYVDLDGGGWIVAQDCGDYGVYWDPSTEQGFAWANLDVAGVLAFGVPRCGADCRQPPDGRIDEADLAALLGAWGSAAAPFDLDASGSVDFADLTALLGAWGMCAAGE